jgi:hypothetical protein
MQLKTTLEMCCFLFDQCAKLLMGISKIILHCDVIKFSVSNLDYVLNDVYAWSVCDKDMDF